MDRLRVIGNHIDLEAHYVHASVPEISLSAKHVMINEKVQICAHGLRPGQKVTLQAFMVESEKQYGSCGHYIADSKGSINTFTDLSHGGTFSGVDAMGLFWSIKTRPGQTPRRLVKADVMSPYDFTLVLHDGFLSIEDVPWTDIERGSLASTHLFRSYTRPGIKRIPVRELGLYGTLFLPHGDGPFPGVLDLFGLTSEIIEFRSALLASYGIASFVVTYVGHEGLPNNERELDFHYFLKAYDFLASQPLIDRDNLGGIATCGGGGFIMLTAYKRPSMKCVVTINGALAPVGREQLVEGETIKSAQFDFTKLNTVDDKLIMAGMAEDADLSLVPPAWQNGTKILFIQGLGDLCVGPEYVTKVVKNIPEKYQKSVELLTYPGAGHLLEPPYSPHSSSNFNPILQKYLMWGGEPYLHAKAQEDSWPKIVAFFHKHLKQM